MQNVHHVHLSVARFRLFRKKGIIDFFNRLLFLPWGLKKGFPLWPNCVTPNWANYPNIPKCRLLTIVWQYISHFVALLEIQAGSLEILSNIGGAPMFWLLNSSDSRILVTKTNNNNNNKNRAITFVLFLLTLLKLLVWAAWLCCSFGKRESKNDW